MLIAFGIFASTALVYLSSRQANFDSEYSNLVTKEEDELRPVPIEHNHIEVIQKPLKYLS